MASLVVLSSIVTNHLMNRYQPLVAAATASVIYCLEPVFGTIFSLVFKTEVLTGLTIIGGLAVLTAVGLVAMAPAPHRD
jgi:drug/metabolite transporter (DMT)-like permease